MMNINGPRHDPYGVPNLITLYSEYSVFPVPATVHLVLIRWFKFTLKPPYSIARGKLQLVIWDTSFWTFWLKFGHKGP